MDFCWLEVDQINFFHNWEHYSSPKYPPNIPFYVKGISLSSFFWYFPLVSLGWGIWLLCGFGRWIAYACLSPSCPFIIQAIPAYREQVFSWTSLSCKKCKIGRLLCCMEFSRQEYWIALSCSSPGDIHDPGTKTGSLHCRHILYHLSPMHVHEWKLNCKLYTPTVL